jgi:glycosyltransferase involved in cell wall biosynthesis
MRDLRPGIDVAGVARSVIEGAAAPVVMSNTQKCLAVIASHPIQYAVPLYQRLARREDIAIKVFFTWHAGREPVEDRGFRQRILWDVPLTSGYEFELVASTARNPGPYRFFGLRTPTLVERVIAWKPDLVLVNGWAWLSHLRALHAFARLGVRTLFRGDSHLLDKARRGPRWWIKRRVLRRVFSWPAGFLVVGSANRAYYEAFGVDAARLHPCPHSIDVARFAEPAETLQREAARWRRELGISPEQTVLLYAGKFERKKRPVELMRTVGRLRRGDVVLVLVGSGELHGEIDAIAAQDPSRFRVLPFQNQSRMPLVYRLGDVFVLPSAYGETWGLAVNEAMSCGRPVVVSDRVGCAADLVDPDCGRVFAWNDLASLERIIDGLVVGADSLSQMGRAAAVRAHSFDIAVTEAALAGAVARFCR